MKAQIITIGDELLIGQTVDTNSAWIGAELSRIGFDITRKISIHDRRNDIIQTLESVTGKDDVILITGGLGPTSDDITKHVLCEFFNSKLITDPEVLAMITEMMKRRGIAMNENNRRQAEVPEECRVLKNSSGTAPGMWFEKEGTIFISMPGVPGEMKHIMSLHVIPELKKRFTSQIIIHKNIMTYGLPEAALAEKLSGFEASLPGSVKLAYLPSFGVIKLRLTATGHDQRILDEAITGQVARLYKAIPALIFAEDEDTFEIVIGKLLNGRKQTVCTAESCTGGTIAKMITSVPGSSAYFKGSIVAYDNEIKKKLLGVTDKMLTVYGAVSENVAKQMAEGVRDLMKTDFAVATSGIAGPDGGSDTKPVGTVCIAVASGEATITTTEVFGKERLTNINRFSVSALNHLRKQIISK